MASDHETTAQRVFDSEAGELFEHRSCYSRQPWRGEKRKAGRTGTNDDGVRFHRHPWGLPPSKVDFIASRPCSINSGPGETPRQAEHQSTKRIASADRPAQTPGLTNCGA